MVVGGNVITRLQEELPKHERFFTEVFDSAILYEGEHALLWLIEALNGQRDMASVPNLMYRDADGVQQNKEIYTEKTTALPLPDFDGFPLDHYFVPERIIPYLATRGCYWGRCTFCDHGQGYFDQYRGMTAQLVVEQVKALRDKYQCRHFLFSDESYPPALFKKVSQLLGGSGRRHQMDDADPLRGDAYKTRPSGIWRRRPAAARSIMGWSRRTSGC